LPLRNLVTLW